MGRPHNPWAPIWEEATMKAELVSVSAPLGGVLVKYDHHHERWRCVEVDGGIIIPDTQYTLNSRGEFVEVECQ